MDTSDWVETPFTTILPSLGWVCWGHNYLLQKTRRIGKPAQMLQLRGDHATIKVEVTNIAFVQQMRRSLKVHDSLFFFVSLFILSNTFISNPND